MTSPDEQNRSSSMIVLVVEDDPLLMMLLVDYVEDAGCEAVEVSSVAEAIRILESRADIRTVLTDLDMSGSTAGLKLALAIRGRWPPIELLMVSARPHKASDLPQRGVLIGKPFDRRQMVAAIRKFAASSRSQDGGGAFATDARN